MARLEAAEMAVGAAAWASRAEAEVDSRWTLVSAALAAIPLVRTRPEAAAITAAWRPTPEALSPTALAMTASELVFTAAARCRARVFAREVIISLFRFPHTAGRQAAAYGRAGILGVRRIARTGVFREGCKTRMCPWRTRRAGGCPARGSAR